MQISLLHWVRFRMHERIKDQTDNESTDSNAADVVDDGKGRGGIFYGEFEEVDDDIEKDEK